MRSNALTTIKKKLIYLQDKTWLIFNQSIHIRVYLSGNFKYFIVLCIFNLIKMYTRKFINKKLICIKIHTLVTHKKSFTTQKCNISQQKQKKFHMLFL